MKKTVVLCDRCGKEIKGEFLKITAYKGRDFDICERCADELLMLVTRHEPASEEKKAMTCCAPARESGVSVADMPEEYNGRVDGKFDAGKAQALRDAGWGVRKIAEEMKVCEQTVYNHTHPAAPKPKKPLEGL